MPDYSERTEVGGVSTRDQIIGLDAYWREVRRELSDGKLLYLGKHHIRNAALSDSRWEIWRYHYDGEDVIRVEGPIQGSWDGRSHIAWDDHDTPSGVSSDTLRMIDQNDLLEQVLGQLKIMNFHLQILTDEEIEEIT